MSIRAIEWAWRQKCPTPTAKLVLLRLAFYASEEDCECWPSQRRIAEACDITREAVNHIVGALIEAGLLHRQNRVNGFGGNTTNLYVVPCDNELPPPGEDGLLGSNRNRGGAVNHGSHLKQLEERVVRKEANASPDSSPLRYEESSTRPASQLFWKKVKKLKVAAGAVGRQLKLVGRDKVEEALTAVEREQPDEPVSFFVACCQDRAPSSAPDPPDRPVPVITDEMRKRVIARMKADYEPGGRLYEDPQMA